MKIHSPPLDRVRYISTYTEVTGAPKMHTAIGMLNTYLKQRKETVFYRGIINLQVVFK
jgi:hypothetical protein